MCKLKCARVFLVYFICNMLVTTYANFSGLAPGCHKVGHTRTVSIPNCVEFQVTTNACRGFCDSWSVPSASETLRANPLQVITSVAECCNIMETEDVVVTVNCMQGKKRLIFKSAQSCSCYHCKRD